MQKFITKIRNTFSGLYLLLMLATGFCVVSCYNNTYDPIGVKEDVIIPYSIVSVEQNTSATEANIELKLPKDHTENFQFELSGKDGTKLPLTSGLNDVTGNFNLKNYTANQLIKGGEYTLTLNYEDSRKNKITTSRNFIARQSKGWRKLPHAPINSGDFTGAALLSPLYNSQLAVYRYQDETKWDILKFDGKWTSSESNLPLPRHSAVAFPLSQLGGRELIFVGFGYINDEKLPGKRGYLSDFWWVFSYYYLGQSAGIIFPTYEGVDRTIKFFLTYDKAFMLKEDYTGAMQSLEVTWDQKECKPMPERTGKLAAFTINEIGYVVNQLAGSAPHVYAYYPKEDRWEKKADFPGTLRDEGTGFSANGKGYFGLGIDNQGNGLRDIWEYNPEKNIWNYHSEYPGQGNRYLVAISDKDKAYLGWGYETRPIGESAGKQQIGCTDFWEFKP